MRYISAVHARGQAASVQQTPFLSFDLHLEVKFNPSLQRAHPAASVFSPYGFLNTPYRAVSIYNELATMNKTMETEKR